MKIVFLMSSSEPQQFTAGSTAIILGTRHRSFISRQTMLKNPPMEDKVDKASEYAHRVVGEKIPSDLWEVAFRLVRTAYLEGGLAATKELREETKEEKRSSATES